MGLTRNAQRVVSFPADFVGSTFAVLGTLQFCQFWGHDTQLTSKL